MGDLWQQLTTLWQKIIECWQIKMLWAGCISCLSFLFGDITAGPFMALWTLVAVDTATRWMAIGRQESLSKGGSGSLLAWVGISFIFSKINSETFRNKFTSKAIAYAVLIIVFNQLDQALPDVMFGHSFVGFPNSFICTWLCLGESKSILENLMESGVTVVKPLMCWAENKQSQMTDSVQPYQYGQRPTVTVPGRPAVRPNFAPDPNDKEGNK